MPLPEQSPFEDLLRSLTPVRPDAANEFVVEQVLPPAPARDESKIFLEKECSLWYRPNPSLTFDALVARVQKELGGRGHKMERSLALCTIALFGRSLLFFL